MKRTLHFVSCLLVFLLFLAMPMTAFAEDTEDPSDVETLEATPLDGAVKLVWSEATDDTGVDGYIVHYGENPVTDSGQEYDSIEDVGDVLEYIVTELENDTTYYFSVVAYDAESNESAAWAPEASATPTSESGSIEDTDAPQVQEAEALYMEQVEVVFSEPVVLPTEDPQDAFAIENDDTLEGLVVVDAEISADDETGKTVILTTDAQEEDAIYKITVGVNIEDLAGNPIISGTSDTAIFTGSAEAEPAEDTVAPKVTSVESVSDTTILVTFDEAIILSIDPASDFEVTYETEEEDSGEVLVTEVVLGDNDESIEDGAAVVTTETQGAGTYTVTVLNVTDEAGNEIDPENNTGTYEIEAAEDDGEEDDSGEEDGSGEEDDSGEPIDVEKLIINKVKEAENYLVTLSWEVPVGNETYSFAQILYLSQNKGTSFAEESTLEATEDGYDVGELEPGEYWFKLTQVDEEGNETEGTLGKVVLAETGPGLIGLLAVSLGLGRFASRRKKRK